MFLFRSLSFVCLTSVLATITQSAVKLSTPASPKICNSISRYERYEILFLKKKKSLEEFSISSIKPEASIVVSDKFPSHEAKSDNYLIT